MGAKLVLDLAKRSFRKAVEEDRMQGGSRERLLEAAGETFAEKGFHRASLREICTRAGMNVAMVKYHFSDKMGLYREVLHATFDAAAKARIQRTLVACPRQRLYDFIHDQLLRVRGGRRPPWYNRLMARELASPSPALDELVARGILPVSRELRGIVMDLLGEGATDREITLHSLSVVGQSLHHHHARAIIERLYPDLTYTQRDIAALAEHIVRFSLDALDAARKRITERAHGAQDNVAERGVLHSGRDVAHPSDAG